MGDFICLTSLNGESFVININHIIGFYRVSSRDDNTAIETTSKYGDGRFLVKESVPFIFDTIKIIRQGGIL